jgi:hypothetical protein
MKSIGVVMRKIDVLSSDGGCRLDLLYILIFWIASRIPNWEFG